MSQKDLTNIIPYGDLAIIPLESSKPIGKKVDEYIVGWRNKTKPVSSIHFTNYKKDSLISLMPSAPVLVPVRRKES